MRPRAGGPTAGVIQLLINNSSMLKAACALTRPAPGAAAAGKRQHARAAAAGKRQRPGGGGCPGAGPLVRGRTLLLFNDPPRDFVCTQHVVNAAHPAQIARMRGRGCATPQPAGCAGGDARAGMRGRGCAGGDARVVMRGRGEVGGDALAGMRGRGCARAGMRRTGMRADGDARAWMSGRGCARADSAHLRSSLSLHGWLSSQQPENCFLRTVRHLLMSRRCLWRGV